MALDLDSVRPGMGIEGETITETLQEFDELEHQLLQFLRFDSQKFARFYEVDAQVLVASDVNTLDSLRRSSGHVSPPNPLYEQIEDALGHPVSRHALHFCSPTASPGDGDWYDLSFEASLRSAYNYFGYLVFRNSERSVVWDVATRITDLFQAIASGVEQP